MYSYLGLFFMYLSTPENDHLVQKKKKDSILCVMDMWRRTAVCLVLAHFRYLSQLSFGHVQHEKMEMLS